MENLSATKQEFGNMTKVILVSKIVFEGAGNFDKL